MSSADQPSWASAVVTACTGSELEALVDDVCWHDSVVYSITCVRAQSADRVVVEGRYLFDWERQRSCPARVTLIGCLHAKVEMHGGIQCMSDGDMIATVELFREHAAIDAVRASWPGVPGHLAYLELCLSTGSTLGAVFQSMCIEPLGAPGLHSAPPPILPGAAIPDP